MIYLPSIASFALLAATTVAWNPGAVPLSGVEVARSSKLHQAARRSLEASQDTLSSRDKMGKSAARRTTSIDELRKKRGLVTRVPYKRTITLDSVLSTTRLLSEADLTMELDQGMSYVRGEYVCSAISEDQSGAYTFVDLELIDVSTCETASDLSIDFWHCNLTGVYSGVLGSGSGNPSDLSSVGRTFLRGIQPTNEEGQAPFKSILPDMLSYEFLSWMPD